jgi:hypothetical protein
MWTQVHVQSRRLLETGEISVYDFPTDQVQVQIILRRPSISRMDRERTSLLTSSYPRRVLFSSASPAKVHKSHTERLSNLIPRGEEADVDKCGHSDAWNRVPRKLCDELKR